MRIRSRLVQLLANPHKFMNDFNWLSKEAQPAALTKEMPDPKFNSETRGEALQEFKLNGTGAGTGDETARFQVD